MTYDEYSQFLDEIGNEAIKKTCLHLKYWRHYWLRMTNPRPQ
jgi:hypothetical protein